MCEEKKNDSSLSNKCNVCINKQTVNIISSFIMPLVVAEATMAQCSLRL